LQPLGGTGAGDVWATPGDTFRAIDRAFGPFDLDAAATAQNAVCAAWWTPEDDGLAQPWKGRVWCNPPYSQTGRWTAKAAGEIRAGNADVAVMLVPARTGSQWWRNAIRAGAVPVYLPGRLKFGAETRRAAFESALLLFGGAGRARVAHNCSICNSLFFGRRDAVTCSPRCRMARQRAD
jgi:phage N-6-adenine-methyltransferase